MSIIEKPSIKNNSKAKQPELFSDKGLCRFKKIHEHIFHKMNRATLAHSFKTFAEATTTSFSTGMVSFKWFSMFVVILFVIQEAAEDISMLFADRGVF